jgi:hypothetical protein
VLSRGKAIVKTGRFDQQPNARAYLSPPPARVQSIHQRDAGGWLQHGSDQAQQGSLARAVRSEKAKDLPVAAGEGYAVHGHYSSKSFGEFLGFDHDKGNYKSNAGN